MYLFSKDRRYLRFIWQVVKFTIVILAVVLIFLRLRALGRADALSRASDRSADSAEEAVRARP